MVGWSLNRQDNKTVNRIAGMSSTLPIGKVRHSDKAKGVPKIPPKEKDYFLEEVQFPVCHNFIVFDKNTSLCFEWNSKNGHIYLFRICC